MFPFRQKNKNEKKKMKVKFVILVVFLGLVLGCQQAGITAQDEERNRKVLEIWNTGNLELVDEVFSPDYERHYVDIYEDIVGADAFKEWVTSTRTTFPDFNVTIHEQIKSGDTFASRWTLTGTNTGPGDFPPTGMKVKVSGANIVKVAEGKIVEEWLYFNQAAMLTLLGFTITPPAVE